MKYIDWRGETLSFSILYRIFIAILIGIAFTIIYVITGRTIVESLYEGIQIFSIASVGGIAVEILKPRRKVN